MPERADAVVMDDASRPPRDAPPAAPHPRHVAALVVLGVALALALAGIGLLMAQLGASHGQNGRLQGLLARRGVDGAVASALNSPGRQIVPLDDASGEGLAAAVVAGTHGFVVPSSLPALPPGRTYQLWGRTGGVAVSLGVLGRRPGESAFTVAGPHPSTLLLTSEPARGAVRPSAKVVASGYLSPTP